MKRNQLYLKDTLFSFIVRWVNRITTMSCWLSIVLDISYFARSNNLDLTILFSLYTPLRYFLFDITHEKMQKRPPSLDRIIPLTIFVRYLKLKFPIPQGNFLASLVGLFLACSRAIVNGYALLLFDTFTFFYQIKNDSFGNSLDCKDTIKERFKFVENGRKVDLSDIDENTIAHLKISLEQTRNYDYLNIWDFPIQRYLNHLTFYFENNEVGNAVIDRKCLVENEQIEV
ncbi:hypothetical protein ERK19_04915 [Lactobacillus helsingborgensis]|uniref:hypothetical protein n=1 Tax=Lactobacillus helsingborgensis TaxID=1218494 RepID=UPI001650078B|nr:hypothetical protein [Lactobacillus helsingborgensis]MBC6356691.1 hypothetical protein [Lactobacillus helsingborgensis]